MCVIRVHNSRTHEASLSWKHLENPQRQPIVPYYIFGFSPLPAVYGRILTSFVYILKLVCYETRAIKHSKKPHSQTPKTWSHFLITHTHAHLLSARWKLVVATSPISHSHQYSAPLLQENPYIGPSQPPQLSKIIIISISVILASQSLALSVSKSLVFTSPLMIPCKHLT